MRLYELKINEDELEEGSEQGIYAISLVENPAIEEDFIYLSREGSEEKVLLQATNDEQQTLIGAVLVPNKKILRRDPQTGEEYHIYFEADTIAKAQELYFKNKNNDKFTVDHKRPVDDIYVFESWIISDPNLDKSRAYGLDLPVGSWVVMAKVENEKIWAEVKNGAYKGFSIEGLLKHNLKLAKVESQSEALLGLIDELLLAQMDEIEEDEAEYMLQSIKGVIKKDRRLKKGARVELESYTDYPEAAKKAAESAIKKNEERSASSKCGTAVGKIRAQQIAQGKPLSYETIKRVYAYLSRAITFIDKSDPDYLNSCAYISVGLWGGEAMLPYARKIISQKEKKTELAKIGSTYEAKPVAPYFPNENRVSFDFDDVLDTPEGQMRAKRYVNAGYNVYIITRRQKNMSDEVYKIADKLGIARNNIYFTGGALKYDTVRRLKIAKHFDNNQNELNRINENVPGVETVKFAEVGERGGIKASPKAPKSDTPNPNPKGEGTAKGDASGKRGAEVSAKDEETLKNKASEFNDKESNTKYGKANVGALKSVFQRGLGAYNTSSSPKVQSPSQWAFARVNAFLYLLKNGRPQNDGYTTDYDLLPKGHPKAE
jgi:hypothetical protein